MSNSNLDKLKNKNIIDYIKNNTSLVEDMVYRKIKFKDEFIDLVFVDSLCSTDLISNFVIRSIEELNTFDDEELINSNKSKLDGKSKWKKYLKEKTKLEGNNEELNVVLNYILEKVSINNVKKIDIKKDDMFYFLFSGFTLLIYNGDILALETKKNLDRSINTPTSENNIKGPKDSFIENYITNIGLIRKRLKTEKLLLEEKKLGRCTKTKVGIMYISNIARKEIVEDIKVKLDKIDIDGILTTNQVMELLIEKRKYDFPTILSTEKPDLICNFLLQGRVALIIENSPFVLVLPAFLTDFINNIDDKYLLNTNVVFTRIVRYIAFILTLVTPAFYIALITFDQESIPTDLLISFAIQRDGVPFPAFFEGLLMILSFEILRETDYRVPNATGNTLSIVGALILGDAAVSAGIVSPIMIIVIAVTMISGLMFSDVNMVNALRSWRLIFLIFSSIAGLYGIGICTIFFIVKLCDIFSANKPYSYPIAPMKFSIFKEEVFSRKNFFKDNQRQRILTDNLTKMKIKK